MTNRAATLLLAFDGSPAALRAAQLLAAYQGDPALLAVHAVNVQPRPASLWPGASLDPALLDAALASAGHRELEPALRMLAQAGIGAQGSVLLDLPARGLAEEAGRCDATAILMGSRGRGAWHGLALGSVSSRVAHRGAVPVVMVRPEAQLPERFGVRLRALCALDGSEPALRALERLVAWRKWLGALEVQLVHVQPGLTLAESILPPHDDVLAGWSRSAGEQATQAARELLLREGVPHSVHFASGDPAEEIARQAAATASEIIVLGTRGLGALHHALLGSVALKTAATSRVPVLLAS